MELQPIALSAKRGNWQRFASRKANPAFRKIAERVWARDDFTCQYCGFQSQKYQEVVNLDQNYSNNALDNLATSCQFCAQCFFLDSVGRDDRTGGELRLL